MFNDIITTNNHTSHGAKIIKIIIFYFNALKFALLRACRQGLKVHVSLFYRRSSPNFSIFLRLQCFFEVSVFSINRGNLVVLGA